MKTKQIKILLVSAVGLVGLLVTVGNGCSKRGDFESNLSSTAPSSTSGGSSTNGNNTDPDYIPGAKTASVVYAKQALDQLTSCAGLIAPSDDTIRMYDSKKSSISSYGEANSVTAPMMMAVANIAGEICDDLIDQETAVNATPRIFVGWDLKSTSRPADNMVVNTITRLALSCWQKPEANNERLAILDLLSSVPVGAGAARKQAVMLCTVMLSSLNSLLN